jgi:hypothetical protein
MCITQLDKQTLTDWPTMVCELAARPVSITSLVVHISHYIGTADASGEGMGGFWLPTIITQDTQPYVWHEAFPSTIRNMLLTTDNTQGMIANSDLELAAIVLGRLTNLHTAPPTPYRATLWYQ